MSRPTFIMIATLTLIGIGALVALLVSNDLGRGIALGSMVGGTIVMTLTGMFPSRR